MKNICLTISAFFILFFFTGCCLMFQPSDNFSVIYSAEDSDGGTIPEDTASYSDGTSVTIAAAGTMTRTGYIFSNWNTAADGKGSSYAQGDKAVIDGRDLYLYAQWDAVPESELGAGSEGPAGGIVIYDKGSISDGWRYIEAAPASTEGPAVIWSDSTFFSWAEGYDFGTGKTNSELIPTSPAAAACLSLVFGGFDDWFLPSMKELQAMSSTLSSSAEALTNENYWSSTEIPNPGDPDMNSNQALAVLPPGTDGFNTEKTTPCRVRAVRYF